MIKDPGSTRIAIVGVGNVGATYAYSLLLSGLAGEIVLIDNNQAKTSGEAMDLNHAVPLTQPTRIWAGKYEDTAGATITVITAGSAQKAGETRLDLVQRNIAILKSIIPSGASQPQRHTLDRRQSSGYSHIRCLAHLRLAFQPGDRLRYHPGYRPVQIPAQSVRQGGCPQRACVHHR